MQDANESKAKLKPKLSPEENLIINKKEVRILLNFYLLGWQLSS